MQISIDTSAKIIVINGTVTLGELIKELGQIMPDFDWENWSIAKELPSQVDWSQILRQSQGTTTGPFVPYQPTTNPYTYPGGYPGSTVFMKSNDDFRNAGFEGDILDRTGDTLKSSLHEVSLGLTEKEDL